MNNIYVNELPKSCAVYECPFNYDICSCTAKEFVDVGDVDIEYSYEKGRHKTCPLKPLSDRLAEERKKVVQELRERAKNEFEFIICDECYNTVDKDVYISSVALTEILDQIERGE